MGKFSSPTGANHRAAATRPRISGWLLGSCCWLAAGLAQADGGNWRWLDSQGRQVFSDLPPPASVPEPRILQRPGPDLPAPAPAPGSTAAGGSPRASAANPEQGQTADSAAEPPLYQRNAAALRENCRRARSTLATLASGLRLYRLDDKGEQVLMDDAMREQETRQARQAERDNCEPPANKREASAQ